MTQTATARDRLTAFTASQPTKLLIESLHGVEAMLPMETPDRPALLITRSTIIVELERRYPEASDAVADAFDAADLAMQTEDSDPATHDVDYVAVLLANIKN